MNQLNIKAKSKGMGIQYTIRLVAESKEWRPVSGYEGHYEVSDNGAVRSIGKRVVGKNYLILRINGDGYLTVMLSKNSTCKLHRIHRLVAEAFIPNPEGKETVNHEDGNKLNNNYHNLTWASRLEQVNHGYSTGLLKTLLDADDIKRIQRRFKETNSIHRCAKEFGVSWHVAKYYIKKETPIGYKHNAWHS